MSSIKYDITSFLIIVFLITLFSSYFLLSEFSFAQTIPNSDPVNLEITPKTTLLPIKLTDTFAFSIKFESDLTSDDFQVIIQYVFLDKCLETDTDTNICKKKCADDEQCKNNFINLPQFPKRIGDTTFFQKTGKTVTTDLVLIEQGLDIIGRYKFRVKVTNEKGESTLPSSKEKVLTFEAKCPRQNPKVGVEPVKPQQNIIKTPFEGKSTPTKVDFKIKVTNNDDKKCSPSKFDIKLGSTKGLKAEQITFKSKELTIAPGSTDESMTISIDVPSLPKKTSLSATIQATNLDIQNEQKPSLSITGVGSGDATVSIEVLPRECKRDFPLVKVDKSKDTDGSNSPGGDNRVVPGETLSYDVQVINTDFFECGSSDFVFEGVTSIDKPKLSSEEIKKWKFTPSPGTTVFTNFEGCKERETLYILCPDDSIALCRSIVGCPSKSIKINVKSDPEIEPASKNFEFTLCFKSKDGKSNCDADAPEELRLFRFTGEGAEVEDIGATEKYSGRLSYTLSKLPDDYDDKESPTLSVKHSPLIPFPGSEIKFLITSSDNVQMKSIKFYIDQGFKKEIFLKDPEVNVETFKETFNEVGQHSYHAIAFDWKSNKACFPSPCGPEDKPNVVAFAVKDNPDLAITDIELTPENPKVGDKLDITVNVINQGTVEARYASVGIKAVKPDGTALDLDVNPKKIQIAARKLEAVSFTSSTNLDKVGEWDLETTVYTEDKMEEADNENNKLIEKVTLEAVKPLISTLDINKCVGEKIKSDNKKIKALCEASCSTGYEDKTQVIEDLFGTPACKTEGKKCCIQTTGIPSLSLSATPKSVLPDGIAISTIITTTSDTRNGITISFFSNRGTADILSSSTCTTGADGKCSITIKSSTSGASTITGSASGYTDGSTRITFTSVIAVPLDINKCVGEKVRKDGKKVQLTCEATCPTEYEDKTNIIEQLFGVSECKSKDNKKCCARLV